jgi:hypothetical protein
MSNESWCCIGGQSWCRTEISYLNKSKVYTVIAFRHISWTKEAPSHTSHRIYPLLFSINDFKVLLRIFTWCCCQFVTGRNQHRHSGRVVGFLIRSFLKSFSNLADRVSVKSLYNNREDDAIAQDRQKSNTDRSSWAIGHVLLYRRGSSIVYTSVDFLDYWLVKGKGDSFGKMRKHTHRIRSLLWCAANRKKRVFISSEGAIATAMYLYVSAVYIYSPIHCVWLKEDSAEFAGNISPSSSEYEVAVSISTVLCEGAADVQQQQQQITKRSLGSR